MAKKKMTEKEKEDWSNLYFYVKNTMGYDENQALSSAMVLRLKGLSTNKFMENGNITSTANYSYETLLATFKYCHSDIQKALRTNNFNNEMHRFNLILKIVERNINTVYIKMKLAEKAKEEAREIDMTDTATYVNTFKKRDTKKNNRLDELW